MSEQRGLTWSGKWHIVKEGHSSEGGVYNVSLCGAYLFRDDEDGRYPKHLMQIKDGTKKSTGDCKLCNRSVGIKTVTVELPEENKSPGVIGNHEWPTESTDSGAKVVIRCSDGLIANDGIGSPYRSAAHARSHAAALLAAAEAAEANA